MTKDGFIRELEECLQGEVSPGQLSDTLDFYRSYIEEEMAGGKTEDQVMTSLGSPRLIARSVIDAYGIDDFITVNQEYVQDADSDDQEGAGSDNHGEFVRRRRSQGSSLLGQKIVFYALVIGIIMAAGILIRILMPLIIVGLVIWFILRLTSR